MSKPPITWPAAIRDIALILATTELAALFLLLAFGWRP